VPCLSASAVVIHYEEALYQVYAPLRYDRITPLLHRLHWHKTAEQIDYKLAVLVCKCHHGTAPTQLADEFYIYQPADHEARRCLRSASSSSVIVRRTQLSTVDDRAVPVASVRIRNGLPQGVASAPSLPVFCRRIIIMRPSSLGGGRILRRTLSVCPSVSPSVRPSRYCYRASRRAT